MDFKGDLDELILDSAEYLFKKTKYHDFHFLVGNPNTEKVERFGVVTSHLVAHSTVFREMLVNSELADFTGANIHSIEISPQVFKLMLIHVYGGQLPTITREMAVQLALCADKYNIEPLVHRMAAVLTPSTVDQVFPALRCVVNINLPGLEQHVTKIIQEETNQVVCSKEFLNLEDNCVKFIVKQEKLAITEQELWKSLEKWAEHQTKEQLKMHFSKMQKKGLFTKVCQIKTSPAQTSANSQTFIAGQETASFKTLSLLEATNMFTYYSTKFLNFQTTSNFKIKTMTKDIELQSFTFRSLPLANNINKALTYSFTCLITVRKVEDGYSNIVESLEAGGNVVCDEDVAMPVKFTNGQLLKLKASSYYTISLHFTPAHGTYQTYCGSKKEDTTCCERSWGGCMTLQSTTPLHIQKIKCKLISHPEMSSCKFTLLCIVLFFLLLATELTVSV